MNEINSSWDDMKFLLFFLFSSGSAGLCERILVVGFNRIFSYLNEEKPVQKISELKESCGHKGWV